MPRQETSWLTNNIIPITITLLTWAVSFGILTTKVDQVIKNQDQQYSMWLQLEKRVGSLELSDATNKSEHKQMFEIDEQIAKKIGIK